MSDTIDLDERIRSDVARDIRRVIPICTPPAIRTKDSPDENTLSAIDNNAMEAYQLHYRVIFCRACVVRNHSLGVNEYQELCIRRGPDLLGNDASQLHVTCHKCGFDMHVRDPNPSKVQWSGADREQVSLALTAAELGGVPAAEVHRCIAVAGRRESLSSAATEQALAAQAAGGQVGNNLRRQMEAGGALSGLAYRTDRWT